MSLMRANNYLNEALEKVESQSVRAWATSAHNYPIFLEMAQGALKKGTSTDFFAGMIVAYAIGL
jgi:hypothetical protein